MLLHVWIRQTEVNDTRAIAGFGFMETLSYVHTYVYKIVLQTKQVPPPPPPPPLLRLASTQSLPNGCSVLHTYEAIV